MHSRHSSSNRSCQRRIVSTFVSEPVLWYGDGMRNTLENVVALCFELREAGFNVVVFGGWAEELVGISAPRQHRDIDLLIVAPNFKELDSWLALQDEVREKRLPHKRAFRRGSLLVELILVQCSSLGVLSSDCHGHQLQWPHGQLLEIRVEGRGWLVVAPPSHLLFYRREYDELAKARQRAYSRQLGH